MLGGVSFVAGVMFLLIGAWPVFGFLGLDVLLIYWAFRINYPCGARLRGSDGHDLGTHRAQGEPSRERAEWTLNPLWVRLERDAHEEFGIERLFLISHGRRLSIAACLGPDEKASFAGALSTALSEAKRGPTRTVP